MPHKVKKLREQQHRMRLPHVEEEPEEEEEENPQDSTAIAKASYGYGEEAERAEAAAAPAMAANLRVESSPLLLGRALLASVAGRRCGPSTPVPSWKMYDNPFANAMAANPNPNPNSNPNSKLAAGARSRRITVSARKLAATVWELQGTPGIAGYHKEKEGSSQLPKPQNSRRNESPLPYAPSPASSVVSQRSLRCASTHNKSGDASRINPAAGTSQSANAYSQVLRLLEKHTGDRHGNTAEVKAVARAMSSSKNVVPLDVKAIQGDVEEAPTTSNDLLKVLNQIWSLEEQHNVSTSMVASLRTDLEKTRAHVRELTTEQSSYREDMERLNKKLDDEKAMLQKREQEAIIVAVKALKEELEDERKSKHKLESQHKKLSKEMSEAKKALMKTLHDLEREQKARELMEDVCDELAREIGEDKAQVEELKRQSAKVREEVEEERKMLQMAEVWREERVQMKLAEARLELEEKNTALDKVRSELEAFLRAKRSCDEGIHGKAGKVASLDEATSSTLQVMDLKSSSGQHMGPVVTISAPVDEKGASYPIQELDDEGSFDDDLHSIELSKVPFSGSLDGDKWVYSNAIHQVVAANGRRSLDRGIPLANRMNRGNQGQVSRQGLERTRSSPVNRGNQGQVSRQGLERTRSSPVEALTAIGMPSDIYGDGAASMLQAFRNPRNADAVLSPLQQSVTFPCSPTRQWGQFWSSPDPASFHSQASKDMPRASRDNSLKAKLLEAKLEGQQARLKNKKGF